MFWCKKGDKEIEGVGRGPRLVPSPDPCYRHIPLAYTKRKVFCNLAGRAGVLYIRYSPSRPIVQPVIVGIYHMFQEIFQSRIWPARAVRDIMITVLIGVCTPLVQGIPQAADTEARLRERIAGFWDAMQKSDFETATVYIHPSSRNLFRHQVPKSKVLKWRID